MLAGSIPLFQFFQGRKKTIIVRVDDGEFLVRWQGYPNEPRSSRSEEHIALLHPKITGV